MRTIASCRLMWAVTLCMAGGALLVGARGLAADGAPRSGVADLAERLKVGLRVKATGDVAFCDAVARSVAEGHLPQRIVDATYTWSLARGRKYPFPAFEHVIRIKAARLGIAL